MVVGVIALLGQQYFLAGYSSRAVQNAQLAYNRRTIPDTWEYIADEKNDTVVLRESKKWIVVDGLASDCDDVSGFTDNADWMIVVVTEVSKVINSCRSPGCIQLTWEMCQRDLGRFATVSALRGPSRLCGYLMAMLSGAEIILDATCDVPIRGADGTFRLRDERPYGLWNNETNTFNPFEHWGIPNAAPEDVYALSDDFPSNAEFMYVSDLPVMTVRQGMAASKSTCVQRADAAPLRSTSAIPVSSPVAIGPNTLASLQTGPTLFTESSRPFIFIPQISGSEQSGLFRTLWFHTLKKTNFVSLAYYKVEQKSHAECKQIDGSQKPVDKYVKSCVDLVQCQPGATSYECLRETAFGVLRCLNMIGESQLLAAWLQDMASLGVQPCSERVDPHLVNVYKISYNYNKEAMMLMNETMATQVGSRISETFSSICPRKSSQFKKKWEPPITDILLIVVVNYESLYDTVPFMEYIHRRYFKYILYCGPSADSFARYAKSEGLNHVTFIAGMTCSCVLHIASVVPTRHEAPASGQGIPADRRGRPHQHLEAGRAAQGPDVDPRWIHQEAYVQGGQDREVVPLELLSWVREGSSTLLCGTQNASSSSSAPGAHAHFFRRELPFLRQAFFGDVQIQPGFELYPSQGDGHILHTGSSARRLHHGVGAFPASQDDDRDSPARDTPGAVQERTHQVHKRGQLRRGGPRLAPWTHYNDSSLYFIHPFKLRLITKTGDGRKFTCDTYLSKYFREATALKQGT
ncbi:hypothetical protein Btru_006021 [Bulinus truncatus]|nr:hypothetical protein Btru_006021 [Bulinus truncatus]